MWRSRARGFALRNVMCKRENEESKLLTMSRDCLREDITNYFWESVDI